MIEMILIQYLASCAMYTKRSKHVMLRLPKMEVKWKNNVFSFFAFLKSWIFISLTTSTPEDQHALLHFFPSAAIR